MILTTYVNLKYKDFVLSYDPLCAQTIICDIISWKMTDTFEVISERAFEISFKLYRWQGPSKSPPMYIWFG